MGNLRIQSRSLHLEEINPLLKDFEGAFRMEFGLEDDGESVNFIDAAFSENDSNQFKAFLNSDHSWTVLSFDCLANKYSLHNERRREGYASKAILRVLEETCEESEDPEMLKIYEQLLFVPIEKLSEDLLGQEIELCDELRTLREFLHLLSDHGTLHNI